MNTQIVPTFAVPIALAELEEKIYKPLKKLKGMEQGDQSHENDDFNILDKVPDTKNKLIKIFTDYINENINYTPDQEYTMTSSWITENNTGAPMTRHNHKNSYYSSVLYFDKVADSHASLQFENPLDRSGFYIESLRPNIFSANQLDVPIKKGLIIFFPSYLFHFHGPFQPNGITRRSLACNYIPINKYGPNDSSLDTRTIHG